MFSWAVLLGLLACLFRSVFGRGFLVTPDFFVSFPGESGTSGLTVYLSQWNPGLLGYSSAQPAMFALMSLATTLGVPPAALQPLIVIGIAFVGAAAFQYLLEPYLHYPQLGLLATVFFLLSPLLFIDVFNSNANLLFDLLLPATTLLALRVAQFPSARSILCLAGIWGFSFAFVYGAPDYLIPLLLVIPAYVGWTRRSARTGLLALASLVLPLATAILLNAPFYLGNLSYFSGAVGRTYSTAISIIPISYGYSTPANFLSFLGAGIYPRYAQYYPNEAIAFLAMFNIAALALGSIVLLQNSGRGRDLVGFMFTLYGSCAAWIFLTKAGWTTFVFRRVGWLAILNYPQEFYAYIVVGVSIVVVLGVDEMFRWEPVRSARVPFGPDSHIFSTPSIDRSAFPARPPLARRYRRALSSFARKPSTTLTVVLLTLLLVLPASFYLSSGDMKVFEAPAAIGFPPQWGSTAPPALYAMYDFLQTHGGAGVTGSARVLVLPFPGMSGGADLRPFITTPFDMTEVLPGEAAAGNLFTGNSSSVFATTVLNELISNATHAIGLLLGEASVEYVLVDLQLNFTGAPRWESWGSLIGAPSAFLSLLRSQSDLQEVFASPLFVAFLNLDYQPAVTGASGVVSIATGSATVPLNRTIGSWPADLTRWSLPGPSSRIQDTGFVTVPLPGANMTRLSANSSNWSSPGPSNRIARTVSIPGGYEVYGVNDSGVMNITFSNSTNTISGASTRLDNNGFYVNSDPVPVGSQSYALQFQQHYTGPSSGYGYVTVFGLNSTGTYLWDIPSYTVASSTQTNVTVPFSPSLESPQTTQVIVSIAFPDQFGSGTLATYSVANISVSEILPPLPSPFLASLFLRQMPNASALPNYAPIPSFDFSDATASALAGAGVPVRSLCIGLCPSEPSTLSDQLFFAYASLDFGPTHASLESAPNALAGMVVAVNGFVSGTLLTSTSYFSEIGVRTSGAGNLTILSGTVPIANLSVSSPALEWVDTPLTRAMQGGRLTVLASGSVQIDSIWLGPSGSSGVVGTLTGASDVTATQSSLTEYVGILGAATRLVMLSQGFDPSWAMSVNGSQAGSIATAGWENGFVVPRFDVQAGRGFRLTFTPQIYHTIVLVVQGVTLAVFLAILVIVFVPRLRRRLTHALLTIRRVALRERETPPSQAQTGPPSSRCRSVSWGARP